VRRIRAALFGIAGVVMLGVIWELYKAIAPSRGLIIGTTTVLPRTSDAAMPHLSAMLQRALEPVTSAAGSPALWLATVQACLFTLSIAAISWLVGVVVGFLLATIMQRFRTAESALLPWVILSQTVPLIALAPLVKRWGAFVHLGPFDWQDWMSVALIASYLAFFPVSIGALRGFASPETAHVDLMRAYGVGWWRTYLRLRVPASVPYLVPALRLAAANAVIGTVVAEVSIGLSGGVGRMIIEFAQTGSSDPAKQWAPIFGAVLVGLVAAAAVGLLGLVLRKYRRNEVIA
jgi:NitT/TauT family transport system permease protein